MGNKTSRMKHTFSRINEEPPEQCSIIVQNKKVYTTLRDIITFSPALLETKSQIVQNSNGCISFASNPLTIQDRVETLRMLNLHPSVIEINFSDNPIDTIGMQALASALKTNHSVTSINLSRCDIEDGGAIALADVLTIYHPITNLNLYDNRISVTGITALASALKSNTVINTLNVGQNRLMGDIGLKTC